MDEIVNAANASKSVSVNADDAQPLSHTPESLFAYLQALGITYSNHEHLPAFTVEQSAALDLQLPGAHTKNLFLRDRKDRHFLVSAGSHAQIDLKSLHNHIGASGRLSFGKPEKMVELLGVTPGSVTLLGVINDIKGDVTVVMDAALAQAQQINCHPLHNAASTTLDMTDLMRFLRATKHEPLVLKLSA